MSTIDLIKHYRIKIEWFDDSVIAETGLLGQIGESSYCQSIDQAVAEAIEDYTQKNG